jgi:hypothetical protein
MERLNGVKWRDAIEWLWRILTVLLVPLGIWLVTTLSSIDRRLDATADRVTVLEQSTLRSADGVELYQQLASRPTRAELQDKLDRLEAIIVRIEVKLDEQSRAR